MDAVWQIAGQFITNMKQSDTYLSICLVVSINQQNAMKVFMLQILGRE